MIIYNSFLVAVTQKYTNQALLTALELKIAANDYTDFAAEARATYDRQAAPALGSPDIDDTDLPPLVQTKGLFEKLTYRLMTNNSKRKPDSLELVDLQGISGKNISIDLLTQRSEDISKSIRWFYDIYLTAEAAFQSHKKDQHRLLGNLSKNAGKFQHILTMTDEDPEESFFERSIERLKKAICGQKASGDFVGLVSTMTAATYQSQSMHMHANPVDPSRYQQAEDAELLFQTQVNATFENDHENQARDI